MQILENLENFKSRDNVKLLCKNCNNVFLKTKNKIQSVMKRIKTKDTLGELTFCTMVCRSIYLKQKRVRTCRCCGNVCYNQVDKRKKSNNNFCSQSCGATYNNTHKTHGNRRSKLEAWLETKLIELYPNLEIHFNRKDAINSELDIYFPALKLAVELNGIFHYEPIYGVDKLSQIQNNDNRKFQACLEQNIELVIIDTSWIKYHKETNSQKILDIIIKTLVLLESSN